MPTRSEIQAFLTSIGHEAASNDQSSLCLTEDIVEALGEVTEGMASDRGTIDAYQCELEQPDTAEQHCEWIYKAMWAARFRGE